MISEQDNTPEEVKGRVTQMTKAIRYKARKEGGNLFKAFNDYMGSQSGISSTERQMVKQKLGLTERYSSWRDELELREVVSSDPKTDDEMEKTIKEKKVKNKIVINPSMQEAIKEIGGTILEVVEIDEQDQELTPDQKKQLQIKSQMMKKQQMLDRQRLQAQRSGKIPMGRAHEGYAGYAPGDVDQKVGAVTSIPKDEQDAAKARLLAKTKAKREMRAGSPIAQALKTDKKLMDLHKEDVEQLEEDSRRTSNKKETARVRSNIKAFGSNYTPPNNWDPDANRGQGEVVTRKQMEKKRRKSLRQEEVEQVDERVLDKAEKGEKERIVKGMKKKFSSFKDRYGKDAKSVMYATATKMAKDNMDTSKSDRRYGVE